MMFSIHWWLIANSLSSMYWLGKLEKYLMISHVIIIMYRYVSMVIQLPISHHSCKLSPVLQYLPWNIPIVISIFFVKSPLYHGNASTPPKKGKSWKPGNYEDLYHPGRTFLSLEWIYDENIRMCMRVSSDIFTVCIPIYCCCFV